MRNWSTLKDLILLYAAKLNASAIIRTITGNLPLVLQNAVNRAIVSLTRYGLCTQDGTPTPADPVPIKCNNGVLKMVDDELPAGYNRVLGFSIKNNAYWEIPNFPMNGSDTLRFSFEAADACNVIGAYSGIASGNNYSLYVSQSSNYLRYKNGAYNSNVDFDTRYDVEITPTGSSGMKVDSTWTAQTFTTPTNFCIGTTSATASSAKLKGNLYGNIEVVGRAKFIPCERISDNVLGYYDLIGETFYMPTSGTPTSLGYDGSHCHLAVVGTPEVLTVLSNLLSRDGETTGKIINSDGTVSNNANYCISAPIVLPTGNYTCTWETGSGARPFSIFAVDESGTPQSDGKLFYQQSATADINTGEFTVEAETLAAASYRNNVKNLAIYSPQQTASVPTLLSVGDVKDEAEIISGLVTRRVTACLYDGTQPVGDVYMSTTGGKDLGAIIVYPLDEQITEHVTAQSLRTNECANTISGTANVSPIEIKAEYMASE